MYSQNDEEKHILEYFKDVPDGKFLDVGAYNGKTFSNTHALALKGWSGVCVEASAKPFSDLMTLYKDNDSIALVNAAVLPDTEDARFLMQFHDSGGDATSTFSEAHRDKWNQHSTFRGVWVPPIYMSSIERTFGNVFDFVNIDVEGLNFDVMMGIIGWDISMLCIEHDDDQTRIAQVKDIMGFEELYRNGENIILAKAKDEQPET